MALETTIVETWMVALFLADPTLAGLVGDGVYIDLAPQSMDKPYILVAFQQGSDENAIGERGFAAPVYQAKAVGKHGDIALLRAAADQIDLLLQDRKATYGAYRIRVQRDAPIRTPEINEGVEYLNLGGMYRCWVGLAA